LRGTGEISNPFRTRFFSAFDLSSAPWPDDEFASTVTRTIAVSRTPIFTLRFIAFSSIFQAE
jgi:hypothetical protein